MIKSFLVFLMLVTAQLAFGKLFQVGPGRTFDAPSKVMDLVSDGDTIEIDAGLYSGDVGTWKASNLFIHCPSGMAHLDAAGKNAGGKAIWVVDGNNTRIENIEFSGCSVVDQNGAGIRQEGNSLELRHCYFHDNDDGILTGASPTSDIVFEACEFANNGFGDGYSHNMYIGNVRSFTMRFCYSHHAKIGHCVKSRAMNNFILYNRIMDEASGTSSYLINLPNGGFSLVLGNVMMKGPNAQNRTLVDYGSEGLSNSSKQLFVLNNTMVCARSAGATFVAVANGTDTAEIINNIFSGNGTIYTGKADTQTNLYSQSASAFAFADQSQYDYGITITPTNLPTFIGSYLQTSLRPTWQYKHPLDSIKRNDRTGFIFIGAQIFDNQSKVSTPYVRSASILPNPFSEQTTIDLGDGISDGAEFSVEVSNEIGVVISKQLLVATNSQIIFHRGSLAAGKYFVRVTNRNNHAFVQGGFVTF